MEATRGAPLLGPALALVAGAGAGRWLEAALPALVALLALGLALGGRGGPRLACLAVGLLLGALAAADQRTVLAGHDPERPLRAEGRVVAHPALVEGDLLLPVRLDRLRRGREASRVDLLVRVAVEWDGDDEPPPIGSRVRLSGRLSRPDVYRNPPRRPPGPWRLRVPSPRFVERIGSPGPMWGLAATLRREAESRLGGLSPGLVLARALVLGERAALPEEWTMALHRWGLSHLLAVSGLHLAAVAGLLYLGVRPLPRRPRFLLVAVAVAAYLLLVGPRPSVVRAAAMAFVGLAALLGERPPQALNALAAAAILLVVADPAVVGELAFQLSVAATLGILVLAPRLVARWNRLPRPLRQPLAVSVAAQVAVLPFLLPATAVLHPLAPLANLVAVPWAGLVLALGLLRLVLAPAVTLRAPLEAALDLAALPLDLLAALPPTGFELVPLALSAPVAILLAAALALLAAAAGRWQRVGALVALLAAGLAAAEMPGRPPGPELVVLDVGQGDAILLRDRQRAYLVDGGGWPRGDFAARVLLPALAGLGVRRLDAAILSHPDRDHCGGVAQLLAYLPVAEVWTTPAAVHEECGGRLVAGGARRRAPWPPLWKPLWRPLWRGRELPRGAWRFTVAHPTAGEESAGNDASLVLAVDVGGRRLLLTGDLEASGERAVAAHLGVAGAPPIAVLKVAHHGSRTSTTDAFLDRLRPGLAIVSAGRRNPYGHPAAEVVARLDRRRVPLLRTDRDGQIRLPLPVPPPALD